jgi:hypothetical protein
MPVIETLMVVLLLVKIIIIIKLVTGQFVAVETLLVKVFGTK